MIVPSIFYSSLLAKCYSIFYVNKFKNIYKEKNQNYYLLIPFTRYTDLSQILALIWSSSIYIFKKKPSNALTCATWVVLCNTTIGYWLFKKELESQHLPDSDKLYYKIFNFIAHGGINILMYLRPSKYRYAFSDIIYPLISSLFWLLFVMQYYYITGDPVYPFLDKNVKIIKKIKIILLLLTNSIIFCSMGASK